MAPVRQRWLPLIKKSFVMRFSAFSTPVLIAAALLALSPNALCKDKKKAPTKDSQDAIEVVGHIPATSGTVTRFLNTQHFSSYYLYVVHEGGKNRSEEHTSELQSRRDLV